MLKTEFLTNLVFNMDNKDFKLLQEVIATRSNKERYGVSNSVELAIKYNRIPSCPRCGSTDHKLSSHTPQGLHRYLCNECGCRIPHYTEQQKCHKPLTHRGLWHFLHL